MKFGTDFFIEKVGRLVFKVFIYNDIKFGEQYQVVFSFYNIQLVLYFFVELKREELLEDFFIFYPIYI